MYIIIGGIACELFNTNYPFPVNSELFIYKMMNTHNVSNGLLDFKLDIFLTSVLELKSRLPLSHLTLRTELHVTSPHNIDTF